jgi:hypothetical protein
MSGGIIGVAARTCQATHARMTVREHHREADTRRVRRLQKKISSLMSEVSAKRTRLWSRNPSRRLDFGDVLFIIALVRSARVTGSVSPGD